MLTKKPILTNSTVSKANLFTADIKIKKSRFTDKSIGRVLAHEVGHLIHYQQKWVTYTEIDPLITSLMDKQAKRFGMSLRGVDRRQLFYETNKKINSAVTFRNKFPDLNDDEFSELISGMADYFGALTKNNIGFGHRDSYYKGGYGKNFQAFEIMAHAFENKYFTNPLFELMFPVEYKESIQLLDELILNIK